MKKIIQTDRAPAAIGTYSQGVVHNGILYASGQIPLDPDTGEMVSADVIQQIHRVFQNLSYVAKAAGTNLNNTLKLNVFLKDLANFPHINEIMAQYFEAPYPARAAIEVSRLPKDSLVEMDALIAVD